MNLDVSCMSDLVPVQACNGTVLLYLLLGTLQENWGKRKIEIIRGLNTLSTLFFPPEIKSKHYYYYYY